jgi:hypothetical protein
VSIDPQKITAQTRVTGVSAATTASAGNTVAAISVQGDVESELTVAADPTDGRTTLASEPTARVSSAAVRVTPQPADDAA